MTSSLDILIQRLEYKFTQPELLHQALTHCSVGNPNNERLEFLGDALLGFVTAAILFHQHEKANEGQLSRLRAALVKKESLAQLARSINLGEHLNLGLGELRSGGHTRDSILANAMEAVFAAVYLDGGIEAASRLVLHLYGERLYEKLPEQNIKDSKTKLQELLQAKYNSLPEYGILEILGSQHEQWFRVYCRVSNYSTETEGSGSNRRRAEQQAAQKMLELIMQKEMPCT